MDILLTSVANLGSVSLHLQSHTILLTFRYVVKELGSKQLPNDRKTFSDLSNNIFPICFKVWDDHNKVFVEGMQEWKLGNVKPEHIAFFIQKLISILKSFRSMVLVLSEENFTKFLEAILSSLQVLLNCMNTIPESATALHTIFHKFLIVHSKILLDLVESENPFILKFSKGLVNLHKHCLCVYSENKKIFSERYIVNCINFLKVIFSKSHLDADILSLDEMQNLLR